MASITLFSGKTRKSRTIPINDCVIHLKRWKEAFEFPEVTENDYVFPTQRDRNKPLSNGALPIMFKRLSKKIGLNRNIFPYLCRHTKLTFLNQKLPMNLLTKFAGHNLKQSQIYAHLSSEDLRLAMQKIWKVKELSTKEKNEIKDLKDKYQDLTELFFLSTKKNKTKEDYKRVVELGSKLTNQKVGLVEKYNG